MACQRGGDPDELVHAEDLPAGRWVHPGPQQYGSRVAAEPAQPASAARNVLRRWANAASMTANTAARSSARGAPRRSKATSAESTPGTGQNTDRLIEPARRAVPYQAVFTLGEP